MRRTLTATILSTLLLGLASAHAAAPAATPGASAPAVAAPAPHGQSAAAPAPRNRPKPVAHYVDLNSASRKELMTLPGVGAAEADGIVKNRPYRTKTELVTKGVMPTGPFLSLRHLVVAMPPGLAAQAKKKQKRAAVASQPQANR
jgi:hypothetical protein